MRSACPSAWGCRCGTCTCMGAWSSQDNRKRQLGHVRCSWTLQVEGGVNSAMVAWCKLEGGWTLEDAEGKQELVPVGVCMGDSSVLLGHADELGIVGCAG